jgi:hypothetical protein
MNSSWKTAVSSKHSFIGVFPLDIIDGKTQKPPAKLVPFLDAAKTEALPCLVLLNEENRIISKGLLPKTANEILALVKLKGGD